MNFFHKIIPTVILVTSCSGTETGSSIENFIDKREISAVIGSYNASFQLPKYKSQVTTVGKLSWKSLANSLSKSAPQRSLQLGSFRFDGLHTIAGKFSGGMSTFSSKYASLGEYWQKLGIDPTKQVSEVDFISGLRILANYQKIDFDNVDTWVTTHRDLAQQLVSKRSHELVAKVLLVAMAAQIKAPKDQGTSLNLSEINNNIWCGGAQYCANGNGYTVDLPEYLRPAIEAALAQPAQGDQLQLTDSGNNMVCDLPVCINGKAKKQEIVPNGYKRSTRAAQNWSSRNYSPCVGAPDGSRCTNNLICGPDTLICHNGNGGTFKFHPDPAPATP